MTTKLKEKIAQDEQQAANAFGSFLTKHRGGELAAELSDALQSVSDAVAEHARPGSLTLIVTVVPTGNERTTVPIDEIRVTMPASEGRVTQTVTGKPAPR